MSSTNRPLQKVNSGLFSAFSILWFFLAVLSYWAFHSYYSLAIGRAVNLDIALVLAALCGAAGWWVLGSRRKGAKQRQPRTYNGLMVYGLLLILQGVVVMMYGTKQGLFGGGGFGKVFYFLIFNLLMHAGIFLIILANYTIGQLAIKRLAPWYSRDSRKILSIAVGISISGLVMAVLGLAGLLYGWLLGLLLAGVVAWQYKAAWAFTNEVLLKPVRRKQEEPLALLPVFLILIAMAVNNTYAVKAFPIGFDGLGHYMNTTHLIADYNALPAGGQAFNWSIFMSQGELLFGSVPISIMLSHFSGILCLWVLYRLARLFLKRGASWMAAAFFYLNPAVNFHLTLDEKIDLGFLFITLSTLLLLLEYRVRLGAKKEVPENTVLFRIRKVAVTEPIFIWALAGWLTGYAFGIKYTGLMSIIAFLAYGFYQRLGRKAAVGVLAVFTGLLFLTGVYRFGYIEMGDTLPIAAAGLCLLVAVPLLFLGFRGKGAGIRQALGQPLLFLAFIGLAYLPWAGKHLAENRQLGLNALLIGKSPAPEILGAMPDQPTIADPFAKAMEFVRKNNIELDAEQQQRLRAIINEYDLEGLAGQELLQVAREIRNRAIREVMTKGQVAKAVLNRGANKDDASSAAALNTAEREEIKRYLGYEAGLPLYLSIPYDLTMGANVDLAKYLDISFLFIFLIPLLFFSFRGKAALGKNLLLIVLLLAAWAVSAYSLYAEGGVPGLEVVRNEIETLLNGHIPPFQSLLSRTFLPLQSGIVAAVGAAGGFYNWLSGFSFLATFGGIAIVIALSFFLFEDRLSQLSPNMKGLLAYTAAFGFLWIWLGNAIFWYGMPVFSLLFILMAYYLYHPEKMAGEGGKSFWKYFLGAAAGLYLFLATVLNFMSTTDQPDQAGTRFQNTFLEYASSSQARDDALFSFNPFMAEFSREINASPGSQVYRVGTYFNYYIRYNDQRVYEDNQLLAFEPYAGQVRGEERFLQILKNNGFKYILFDLNTAGIDRTPEQSLARRANRFFRLLLNSRQVKLVFTDNMLQAPPEQRTRLRNLTLPGQLGLSGETRSRGTFALFELQ